MSTPEVDRDRDIDETRDIKELIREVIPWADEWMNTPHRFLGAQRPIDLIGTSQEIRVRELVRAIKHGMFS